MPERGRVVSNERWSACRCAQCVQTQEWCIREDVAIFNMCVCGMMSRAVSVFGWCWQRRTYLCVFGCEA